MSANTYNGQTAKLIATIIQNMPELTGDQMQYWISNPALAASFLQRTFLPKFSVWKTVKIGVHKTVEDLILSVEKSGCVVTKNVKRRLKEDRPNIGGEEREIDLVLVKADDLGLPRSFPYLCSHHMKALGFECVTPEIAMTVRAAYTGDLSGSCENDIWALESPQGTSELDSHFFIQKHFNKPTIDMCWSSNNCQIGRTLLVYVRPRK